MDFYSRKKKRRRKSKGKKSKKKGGSKKRKRSKKKRGSKKKRSKKKTEAPTKKTQPKKQKSNAKVHIAVNAKVKCEEANLADYNDPNFRFCYEQEELLIEQRMVARGEMAPKKQPIIQRGVKCKGMEEYLDVWDKHNLCQCKGNLDCYFMSERMNE